MGWSIIEVEKRIGVENNMADIADYYIDKIIDRHLEGPKKSTPVDYWITKNGDAIRYEDLEESHARNILRFVEKCNAVPHPLLVERVQYFDDLKKKLEDLF
jgi:hypothetical protein